MLALKPRRADRTEPKPASGVEPPPVPAALPGLPYEHQPPVAGVPRRWLLAIVLLLLLNVVATTSISWGPTVVQAARQALADRRAAAAKAQADAAAAAADAAALQQREARQAQAAAFTIPAGQVIYTEDPVEADRLVKEAAGYSIIRSANVDSPEVRAPHPPVQWDGTADLPKLIDALYVGGRGATLLLHERRTPGGKPVIVWVSVEAERDHSSGSESAGTFASIWARRRLVSHAIQPLPARHQYWRHTLTIEQRADRRLRMKINPDRSAPDAKVGVVTQEAEVLRFLAGRVDSDDATHFEIDYTFDGRPGTIDGWVREDGRLRIEPREGVKTVVDFSSSSAADDWDPRGTAAPLEPTVPTPAAE